MSLDLFCNCVQLSEIGATINWSFEPDTNLVGTQLIVPQAVLFNYSSFHCSHVLMVLINAHYLITRVYFSPITYYC